MGSQRGNPAFVRSIIYLAKALDLSVVAEGVETEVSAARLAELGCETAQGYYYARPLGKAAFGEWLSTRVSATQSPETEPGHRRESVGELMLPR